MLFDGLCALCNGTVRLVLRFDRSGAMQFAPLEGPTAQGRLAAFPELDGVDSLVLIEGDRASVKSAAVFGVLRYLGGFWRAVLVFRIIPREIRDALYDVVAFWRKRLFGSYEACPVPPQGERDRFHW